jgi:hypothetical protein
MSVDKNTVLIAEQVGVFLAPTLRAIVDTLLKEALGNLKAKLGTVEEALPKLRTEHSTELHDALRGIQVQLDEQGKTIDSFSSAMAANFAASNSTQTELRNSIDAVRESHVALRGTVDRHIGDSAAAALRAAEVCRELSTASVQQRSVLDSLTQDVMAVKELTLSGQETVHRDLGALREQADQTAATTAALSGVVKALENGAVTKVDIDTAISSIKAIEPPAPPAPDLDAVVSKCTSAVLEKVNAAIPEMESALRAHVAVHVASAVEQIELPAPKELDLPALYDTVQEVVTARVDNALPALRATLTVSMQDEIARTVAALPKAKDGEPGPTGPAGLMGTVEPYVEGCVYERSALVAHGGGTWQATRRTKTAPAANLGDWQAIAVGVAQVSAKASDDLRTVEVVASLTDGTEARHVVEVPAMVYRDVYSDTEQYGQADVVTHAGSMWFALRDTLGEPPSKSPEAWRLIVKQGQTGRPGRDGADGVQFQAGFEGEYEEGRVYPKNAITTYASSIWMSKRPTKERPPYLTNADSDHWLRLR